MAEARFPLLVEHEAESIKENYESKTIPSWDDVSNIYKQRWAKEKEKFQTQLKCNFFSLVERVATGKQEIFMLTVPERKEKLYISAFLELFQSQYAPHVGDVERLAGKKTHRLFVTLPNNYE